MINQVKLKERLHYNPLTGLFTWRKHHQSLWVGKSITKVKNSGYITIRLGAKLYQAHRLAFLYMEGAFPPNDVDHKDGVPYNNAWFNLRHATDLLNMTNKQQYKSNTSKITGVGKYKGRWRARIMIKHKDLALLYTNDFFEACCARKSAEIQYNFTNN